MTKGNVDNMTISYIIFSIQASRKPVTEITATFFPCKDSFKAILRVSPFYQIGILMNCLYGNSAVGPV